MAFSSQAVLRRASGLVVVIARRSECSRRHAKPLAQRDDIAHRFLIDAPIGGHAILRDRTTPVRRRRCAVIHAGDVGAKDRVGLVTVAVVVEPGHRIQERAGEAAHEIRVRIRMPTATCGADLALVTAHVGRGIEGGKPLRDEQALEWRVEKAAGVALVQEVVVALLCAAYALDVVLAGARNPPCSSIARNTNAYPVVIASTVRVPPRRSAYDFTSGSVTSVGSTRVSAAMEAKRSGPITGASPCPTR